MISEKKFSGVFLGLGLYLFVLREILNCNLDEEVRDAHSGY